MPFDFAPPVETDVSRLIEAGIARIRKPRHWLQGKTRSRFLWIKRRCLMEAVFPHFMGGFAHFNATEKRAFAVLCEAAERRGFSSPISFNDYAYTTHADVIVCMHEAAESARFHSP
jgi:hypothetical protein